MQSKLALPWKMVHMAICNVFILHSFGHSVRSLGSSVVWLFESFGRPVVRSPGRSVVRSFVRSVVRLFLCFFVCLPITAACHLSLLHFSIFLAWPQVIFPCVIAVDKENE